MKLSSSKSYGKLYMYIAYITSGGLYHAIVILYRIRQWQC